DRDARERCFVGALERELELLLRHGDREPVGIEPRDELARVEQLANVRLPLEAAQITRAAPDLLVDSDLLEGHGAAGSRMEFNARLAAVNRTATPAPSKLVYRWDLDKTYLRTEFDTVRDLLRTAVESPARKRTVPGASALLRELRATH